MNTHGILILSLLLCLGLPLAAQKTAQVTVKLVDEQNSPLTSTKVSFKQWEPERGRYLPLFEATTDKDGAIVREIALPDHNDFNPRVRVRAEHDDFFPTESGFGPLPDGKHRINLVLRKRQETTLRILEADGKPAAHRRVSVSSFYHPLLTDGKGQLRFTHPALTNPWRVHFRGESFDLSPDQSGGKTDFRLTGRHYLPPSQHQAFSNTGPNTPPSAPPARLRGRLLHHDGSPARGWFVATAVTRGGGMQVINMPSTIQKAIEYRKLIEVGRDGRFELFPAFEDLVVVSPKGIPFHFPISPRSWHQNGYVKNTTITLPKMETRTLKLRWDSENGDPAAGVELIPRNVGRHFDTWSMGPASAGRDGVRFKASADFPDGPLEALEFPRSNKKGEITIPVRPWRRVTAHSWRTEDLPVYQSVVGLEKKDNGDVVVLKRNHNTAEDQKTYHFNRFPLSCTFTDSFGEPVDAQKVRWEFFTFDPPFKSSHGATGGFVKGPTGHPSLYFGRTKHRIDFHYDHPKTGKTEFFTYKFKSEAGPPLLAVKFATERKNSLSGRVLDHKGNPVPKVRLHLTRPNKRNSGTLGFTHIIAFSDKAGAFHFEEAPWKCGVYATTSWQGHSVRLNELLEVPAINAANRKVDLKLKPFGSVRIKLTGAKRLPNVLHLKSENQKWGLPLRPTKADPSVFYAPFLPVGDYQLSFTHLSKSTSLREELVSVAADRETVLEVPAAAAMTAPLVPAKPKRPARITVRLNGKPAPGVLVRAMPGLDEKIVGALTSLGNGGFKPHFIEHATRRHIFAYAGDITDDGGQAHLPVGENASLFVAAMDLEQRVAWENFSIDDQGEFILDLQPLAEALPKIPKAQQNPDRVTNAIQRAIYLLGIY